MGDKEEKRYWGKFHSWESDDEVEECEPPRMIWIGPMTREEMKQDFDEFRHNSKSSDDKSSDDQAVKLITEYSLGLRRQEAAVSTIQCSKAVMLLRVCLELTEECRINAVVGNLSDDVVDNYEKTMRSLWANMNHETGIPGNRMERGKIRSVKDPEVK